MKTLLLHVCCGACSTHVIQELKKEYNVTVFFYNPNIYPYEEYCKRLNVARGVAVKMNVKFIDGDYDSDIWETYVSEYANEREGGKRCELCYAFRLRKTAEMAHDYDLFATTLTISPHKNAEKINEIGKNLEKTYGVKFLSADFKKKSGFLKSVALSKEMKLYRQNYCGCRFSLSSSIASPKL